MFLLPALYLIKLHHRLRGLRVEVVDRVHVRIDLVDDRLHRRVRLRRAAEARLKDGEQAIEVVAVGDELVDEREPARDGLEGRLPRRIRIDAGERLRHLAHLIRKIHGFRAKGRALRDKRRRRCERGGIIAGMVVRIDLSQCRSGGIGRAHDRFRDDGPLRPRRVKLGRNGIALGLNERGDPVADADDDDESRDDLRTARNFGHDLSPYCNQKSLKKSSGNDTVNPVEAPETSVLLASARPSAGMV